MYLQKKCRGDIKRVLSIGGKKHGFSNSLFVITDFKIFEIK